jgi:hypothetical protein
MDDLTAGGSGERATGTPNTIYDLSSVLFHALEGGASYDTYIEDAEREGDEELVDFFRRVRDEDSMRADEAQRLLAGRVEGRPDMDVAPIEPGLGGGAGRVEPDVSPRTEPFLGREGMEEAPPPRTSGIEEGTLPREEEAPPRTERVSPPREGAVTGDVPGGGVSPSREGDTPLGGEDVREPQREREEDRGLLDKAKDAILGEEEEPRRREGSDRPDRR